MYQVQHRRRFPQRGDFALIASDLKTLKEAKEARQLSGDLVIESATGRIVTDKSWLWDWEINDSTAYAHRAIDWQVKHPIN